LLDEFITWTSVSNNIKKEREEENLGTKQEIPWLTRSWIRPW